MVLSSPLVRFGLSGARARSVVCLTYLPRTERPRTAPVHSDVRVVFNLCPEGNVLVLRYLAGFPSGFPPIVKLLKEVPQKCLGP